jgi:FkbH-like protein
MLFELDKYEKRLHRAAPAKPELPFEPANDVLQASLLYWAEHCVECAAPECYRSCDLYQPRIDTRCRRFTFGAFKNRNFPSRRGYGVEISFKKWAKMEAYGNLRLEPLRALGAREKLAEFASPPANVIGGIAARLTGKTRWKALTNEGLEAWVRRLDREKTVAALPDAFLLEIYNPELQPVSMQLSFASVPAQFAEKNGLVHIAKEVIQRVECVHGYTRHEVDFALLRPVIDAGPFVVRMIPEADTEARLVFLTAEFVKFRKRAANATGAKRIKCVVFDLDNTLWKGVLVEGDRIRVQPEMERLIKYLDQRGVLLSIASKNDHQSALRQLKEVGLSEYFLYPQINWNPKSSSIKTIAARLNIGVDSLAFVDDNPFELDEVAAAAPEVVCVNAASAGSLFSDPRFQGSATPEARRRRQLYRDAEARETAQEAFGSDYLGFLASCQIRLEISRYSPQEADRVAELVQRTNQLNFSGRKYSREELEGIVADPALEKLVLKCSDRYGSYGTVGFCIVENSGVEIAIRDFMLSCRVQGKLLEQSLFNHLLESHNPNVERLWVNFRPTSRNKPAQQVLAASGFRSVPANSADADGVILDRADAVNHAVIQVRCCCATESDSTRPSQHPAVRTLLVFSPQEGSVAGSNVARTTE